MAKAQGPKKVNVLFGKASVGADSASIGIQIDRKEIKLAEADNLLCGARLSIDAVLEQLELGAGDDPATIKATADVNRFGCNQDKISATLNFKKDDVDFSTFGKFANQTGSMTIERTGDSGTEPAPADDPTE